MKKQKKVLLVADILSVALGLIIFCVPFAFMLVNSLKDRKEAGMMNLSLPSVFHPENYVEVIKTQDYMVVRSFVNSTIITVFSVLIMIIVCAMGGYILQRRTGKGMTALNFLMLIGLMLPPAILPTIWVMKGIGIYGTKFGMILVEVALQIPFTVMLYRGYMPSIPRELEEAAFVDGCGKGRMFFQIIFPLLLPITATVTILNAVTVFNDFVNPLYFLPGGKNATIQLTLNNFMGRYASQWNLLFANVIIITIPMFILFLFFNKRIVAGMAAGSVKG